jgi:hypothetical protein
MELNQNQEIVAWNISTQNTPDEALMKIKSAQATQPPAFHKLIFRVASHFEMMNKNRGLVRSALAGLINPN